MKSTEKDDVKRKRVLYVCIAILAAAVLVSSTIQFFTTHRIITTQQDIMMGRELEILKTMAEDALKTGDDLSLIAHLCLMEKNRAIHRVSIMDNNGIIRISTNPRLNGSVYSELLLRKYLRPLRGSHAKASYTYSDREGTSITEKAAFMINPFTSEAAGYAVISFRTAALSEQSWRAGMWFLVAACAVILAGGVVILYVGRNSDDIVADI